MISGISSFGENRDATPLDSEGCPFCIRLGVSADVSFERRPKRSCAGESAQPQRSASAATSATAAAKRCCFITIPSFFIYDSAESRPAVPKFPHGQCQFGNGRFARGAVFVRAILRVGERVGEAGGGQRSAGSAGSAAVLCRRTRSEFGTYSFSKQSEAIGKGKIERGDCGRSVDFSKDGRKKADGGREMTLTDEKTERKK